jgi:hypothetical protein
MTMTTARVTSTVPSAKSAWVNPQAGLGVFQCLSHIYLPPQHRSLVRLLPPHSPDPQAGKPDKPTDVDVLDAKPAGGCPFGHDKPKPEAPKPELETPRSDERPKDNDIAIPKKTGCPFGRDKPKAEVPKLETETPWTEWPKTWPKDAVADQVPAPQVVPTAPVSEDSTTKPDMPSTFSTPSHITFNGPVFFGYSAEETANLLQQFGNLGKS